MLLQPSHRQRLRLIHGHTLSPLEVVESVTIVVPGLSRSTTVARNAMSRLRLMASPLLSTTPLLSTSVSRTMPRSAPTSKTASMVGFIASGSCYNTQRGPKQGSALPVKQLGTELQVLEQPRVKGNGHAELRVSPSRNAQHSCPFKHMRMINLSFRHSRLAE